VIVVADASVSIKWFFPDLEAKEDADKALDLLKKIRVGEVELIQPPHWLPEVVAVISRIRPSIAEQAIDYLTAMEIRIEHDPDALKIAAQLSRQLNHHLFDTYYHALAIFNDAVFVTADSVYYRKVGSMGNVKLIRDWLP
jgi:predicted nucleic acid-binding protein